uniref:DUF7081 domain-containing protein n=1 Tax=Davidia involucrata TaxID=16924 RepID=A0A5B7BPR2_DAVIN
MEVDIPNVSKSCPLAIKNYGIVLRPVSPCDSGEGLPYAPIDWPNPGDIWSWKVGKRINSSGYYNDRFLIVPKCLQKLPHRKVSFASKRSVKQYLQMEFPSADLDAFFASFSWEVPSKVRSWRKVKVTPLHPKVPSQVETGGKVEEKEEIPRKRKQKLAASSTIYRRQTRKSSKQVIQFAAKNTSVTIDLCSKSEERGTSVPTTKDLKSNTDFENGQISSHCVAISPACSFTATHPSTVACKMHTMDSPEKSPAEVIPEEFDNYLNSLDDILAQPLSKAPFSPAAVDHSAALKEELAEARKKLSSLLAMDFLVLVSPDNLTELMVLSSKLWKDPSLSAEQLSMLKLIKEIPLTVKDFLETKKTTEQADKFFVDLEANIAKATSLRNEYNESREKAAILQAEVDSSSLAIMEIDDQIALLQHHRAALSSDIEIKKKVMVQLTSTQRMVVDCLPEVVREVQLANSERLEWELKKKHSAAWEVEILAKFAPLKGFSL